MALNVTTAVIGSGCNTATATPSLAQWDVGQVLKIEGVDLPSAYQVDFSTEYTRNAIQKIGNAEGVAIPNELLQRSAPITAYIVLHEGEDDRETEYWITIYITPRTPPETVTPDPEQVDIIDEAIAALNNGVAAAEAAAQSVQNMGAEAETLTPGSPLTVTKEVDPETGAVTLIFGLTQGPKGDDGYSPTITITEITGGHRFTVTDKTHPSGQSFDVLDGTKGDQGDDGYSPAITITEITGGHRFTVTDKTHPSGQSFDVLDGTKGDQGDDGYSPAITITEITGGHSVTITDKTHPSGQTFDVMDGVIQSVNGKSAASITLDSGDIEFDDSETYAAGSIGAEVSNQKNAISELDAELDTVTYFDPLYHDRTQRRIISIADKEIKTSTGTANYVSLAIAVKEGQVLKITGSASAKTFAEFAFALNGVITSVYPSESAATNTHTSTQIVVVPSGVNELYVSSYSASVWSSVEFLRNVDDKDLLFWFAPDETQFEIGTMTPTTGQNLASNFRIRTKGYLPSDVVVMKAVQYGLTVYAYTKTDDTYVGRIRTNKIEMPTNDTSVFQVRTFDFRLVPEYENYNYRIVIERPSSASIGDVLETISFANDLHTEIDEIWNEFGEFQKKIDPELYFAADDVVEDSSLPTDVFALYDTLVDENPNYVTKNTLTVGTFENFEYVFDSHAYNYQSASRPKFVQAEKPEILITTGVHGNESAAVMSAYTLFKALCDERNALKKLRQSFVFRVIPIVTPWGFEHGTRWNENGVNINRNFDADWTASGAAFENNYSGPSAASEVETQLVQAWLDAHTDAALYIDFHNSGYTSEVSYLSLSTALTDFITLQDGYRYGENQVIGHWIKDREMTASTLIYAYDGYIDLHGNSELYGDTIGIQSMTLETSNNQNDSGVNSKFTIGVGAEAFAALLNGLMNYHFKV